MTDRQLNILGIAVSVVLFVVGGVGAVCSDPNQRTFWIAVFASLGGLSLLSVIARAVYLRVRGVHFVSNFGQYCDECKFMLQRAKDQDEVLTIQTPVSLRPGRIRPEHKIKYDQYIGYTISRLITSDLRYRRIVVLRSEDQEPVEKIKDFLQRLVEASVARERQHVAEATPRPFDLTNITIGFVDSARSGDSIYSNLDIHITTESEFAVAFLSRELAAEEDFGGSLHLRDLRRRVSRRLRGEITSLWQAIQRDRNLLDLSEHYGAPDGKTAKSDADQRNIIATLNAEVDRIVRKAIAPPPPGVAPQVPP